MSDFVRGFGVPIIMNNRLSDGQIISTVDPITRGKVVYVGTHKTYVDSTIRRLTRDVFSRDFLERIGMWQPTGEEVLQTLKDAGQ